MPVVSHELKLVYFDVPKVACTTLKTFFRQVETAERPRPSPARRLLRRRRGADDGARRIHQQPGYRTQSFLRAASELSAHPGYVTFTVVRDPVDRLRSAWKDKVNRASLDRRGETEDALDEGLLTDPSFGEFLEAFAAYRTVSRAARVHTHPYAWHLGPSAAAYDRVFRIERMDEVERFLSERVGAPVSLRRQNEAAPSQRDDTLNERQLAILKALTASEYAWLGDLYDQEARLSELA